MAVVQLDKAPHLWAQEIGLKFDYGRAPFVSEHTWMDGPISDAMAAVKTVFRLDSTALTVVWPFSTSRRSDSFMLFVLAAVTRCDFTEAFFVYKNT